MENMYNIKSENEGDKQAKMMQNRMKRANIQSLL